MDAPISILLIDDEIGEADTPHQRAFLRAHSGSPFQFRFSSARSDKIYTVAAAVECLIQGPMPDIVLLDLQFGEDGDRLGLEILKEINSRFPATPVLVLSALNRDVAVLGQCLEEGATGFIEKATKPAALKEAVRRSLEMVQSHALIGKSPLLRELRRQAARLSPYDQIPVLIVGERGTGKERVARGIHHNGPRRDGAFVAVNCAAVPEALLEAEFFGAEKGAYTGSVAQRIGLLERAHRGLLFLDEIGDMPLATQAKLLRVLQDGTYRRVGSSEEELRADFQLVCASNVDPGELLAKGRLREDFYDRIAAVTVRTPALRECRSDIPELCEHFLRELPLARKKRLTGPVLERFAAFSWPGNFRQLQRAIQEAVVRSEDSEDITVEHLPQFLRSKPAPATASNGATSPARDLPEDHREWSRVRLLSELQLAIKAKRRVQESKGSQWKAAFMRQMYPHCRAQNAKGFNDLIRRLTKGPWGLPEWADDAEIAALMQELQS